jgi:hypothetical protein
MSDTRIVQRSCDLLHSFCVIVISSSHAKSVCEETNETNIEKRTASTLQHVKNQPASQQTNLTFSFIHPRGPPTIKYQNIDVIATLANGAGASHVHDNTT